MFSFVRKLIKQGKWGGACQSGTSGSIDGGHGGEAWTKRFLMSCRCVPLRPLHLGRKILWTPDISYRTSIWWSCGSSLIGTMLIG
ncbi:hypothetical protein CEXT_730551 [Caerostris extrusa]|uniref:Uncharacterized protein n=1 Tax=Caerostris extrusa TaxID=172846 RepID=A0AAV4NLF9_CAEEX|nr:hypothetical protein CEXT_730551 [Caerostris extrusa]